MIVRNWSIRGTCGIDLRGYRGARGSRSVFGRWNATLCRTLRELCACAPCSAAFFAVFAFASGAGERRASKRGDHMEDMSG